MSVIEAVPRTWAVMSREFAGNPFTIRLSEHAQSGRQQNKQPTVGGKEALTFKAHADQGLGRGH